MGVEKVAVAVAQTDYAAQIIDGLRRPGWQVEPVETTDGLRGLVELPWVVWAHEDLLSLVASRRLDDPYAPVVMVTDDDPARMRAARAVVGRLAHVTWPILADELVPRLRAQLERARLSGEVRALRAEVSAGRAALDSTSTNLATATDRLVTAEQLAAVGRVVTGIAHEIASQLALVGYAEAIKVRVKDDPELVQFADVIVSAQKRLSAMVDEIRDFAAAHGVGDGGQGFELQPAELGTLAQEALALMSYDPQLRSRELAVDIANRALARVDRKRFEQVVINLVSNAVLATEPGQNVTVRLDVDGDEAVLAVSDSGRGMTPEVVARLGEIFFTTRGDRSSGLGVGICRRIVEEHGGTLSFESELGRGTTATIRLPVLESGTSHV
ncbi:MAG: HAMP domain-containing histidine kinase [Deltaproteobacteria bacterium]|nr:HAMP domain-containing histidine kinase [Deltaproteobacteria bacterium]